jgi:hypothetical protein
MKAEMDAPQIDRAHDFLSATEPPGLSPAIKLSGREFPTPLSGGGPRAGQPAFF